MNATASRHGAWAGMARASEVVTAFRAALVPPYPEQMLLRLDPRWHCAICEDTEATECESCGGFSDDDCKTCGGDGQVACACVGGPEDLDDDDEGDDDERE